MSTVCVCMGLLLQMAIAYGQGAVHTKKKLQHAHSGYITNNAVIVGLRVRSSVK